MGLQAPSFHFKANDLEQNKEEKDILPLLPASASHFFGDWENRDTILTKPIWISLSLSIALIKPMCIIYIYMCVYL